MNLKKLKRKIHTLVTDRRIFFKKIQGSPIYKYLPDIIAIKLIYHNIFGRKLDLDNPKTFNEKLQWLKLYNRKPEYTTLVDKIEVKKVIGKLIGETHIVPTLGVYDSFDKIDFSTLPDKFVIKTNHGGGNTGVVICRDKSQFDVLAAKRKIEKSLATDTYIIGREWPYKNIKRKILVEKLLVVSDDQKQGLVDYKFFCFNGKPLFLKVDFNRETTHQANYYDFEWNLLNIGEKVCPPNINHIERKPIVLDKMIEIAETVSLDIPFVRVDLYYVQGQIYFGEMTFFPASGFGLFTEIESDIKLGTLLKIQ